MDNEMESLIDNNTFTKVPRSEASNVKEVGGRWVYSIKDGGNDTELFKARYVAKGYSQIYGLDYFETFAPTAKLTSLRILFQIAAQENLVIHQMDVKSAYLNAPIDVKIYLEQPKGYTDEDFVWLLNKSIYGLKQSGRQWNAVIHKFFINHKFKRSEVDACVYFFRMGNGVIIILIWVDDIILASNLVEYLNKTKNLLKRHFKMKDLGPISNFLGIHVVQTPNVVELDQSNYLLKLLIRFGMIESKPRYTPCEKNPSAFSTNTEIQPESCKKYREIVGSLIYLMTCTRPDLSWVVTKLSQHLDSPDSADWIMLDHVI